jgi:hypothetical protein
MIMATPYIHERQSEYWTSRQVEEFFLDLGYEVLTLPLTQLVEKNLPADFLFFDRKRCKLFGFQYKALYKNTKDHWLINADQHNTLSEYPWLYYCLSELRNANEHRIALHLTRIIDSRFKHQEKIFTKSDEILKIYSRWGAFYQGIEKCFNGIIIDSPEHLKELIMRNKDDPHLKRLADLAVDVFLADLDLKNMIHYSPFLQG